MYYQTYAPNQNDMKWVGQDLLGIESSRFPAHFTPRGRGSPRNHPYRPNRGYRGARNNTFQSNNYNSKRFCKQPSQHFCRPCEAHFDSADQYDLHKQHHVKCQDETCTFEAEEEIVYMHFRIEHLANFADKPKHLSTPEEDEQWQKDRRKNFPTARKIAEKEALYNQKNLRGEVLQTQRFGKFKRGMSNERGGNRGRFPNKRRRRPRKQRNNIRMNNNDSDCETVHPIWGLKKFEGMECGTQVVNDEGEITGSDDENDIRSGLNCVDNNLKSGLGSLQSLSQYYQTSSDEEMEEEKDNFSAKPRDKSIQAPRNAPIPTSQPASIEVSQSTPVHSSQPAPIQVPRPTPIQSSQSRINTSTVKNLKSLNEKFKRRFTLLEMLLAPDIRHERNAILQCIRYIVDQNFFQK